uniref:Transposase n=1 Tax=Strongyloides papillosus TaxID=174720 RepID=A0A0N5BSR7_STREA
MSRTKFRIKRIIRRIANEVLSAEVPRSEAESVEVDEPMDPEELEVLYFKDNKNYARPIPGAGPIPRFFNIESRPGGRFKCPKCRMIVSNYEDALRVVIRVNSQYGKYIAVAFNEKGESLLNMTTTSVAEIVERHKTWSGLDYQ